MKKQLIVASLATAVSVAGLSSIGIANAATDTNSSSTNPVSSLVDEITSKFNLNKSDVQAVFDSHHDAMDAKRESNLKDRLTVLVQSKKLSQSQADAIQVKHDALVKQHEANRDNVRSETDAERKAAHVAQKADIDAWAKQNNIPSEYVHLVQGRPGRR
jgi:predicted RND superfamily exporter protein